MLPAQLPASQHCSAHQWPRSRLPSMRGTDCSFRVLLPRCPFPLRGQAWQALGQPTLKVQPAHRLPDALQATAGSLSAGLLVERVMESTRHWPLPTWQPLVLMTS